MQTKGANRRFRAAQRLGVARLTHMFPIPADCGHPPPYCAEERAYRNARFMDAYMAEMSKLGEGITAFAAAAHDREPPEELRDRVLGALDDEWRDAPAEERRSPLARYACAGRSDVRHSSTSRDCRHSCR